MNGETKRHIDAARQVLVGVVPSPTAQIDQITNALIFKFMDDMDQAAIKAGGNPSFFTGDLERYAWTRLMDTRIGNQERMNLYSEALLKFSQAKQLPLLFRELFKSAFLPYRSPETLNMFLKEIEYFDYSHSEELGNAYEYLLSIMSSQGDAGQFRTPRHIIDFMVEVVAPTKDDTVLDPACGTAGFLISAYKHILRQHDGKDNPEHKEKPLTPEERKKLINNFEGYDIDPTMARIAQVNMYLHQFKNPRIYQYDTLSQEERWNDRFDVIMANPPFMSPKGGIKPHSKFSIQSSRSEVLFVDYIMEHLKPKGRAAIIVPEGIIFQSGKGHTQLRKNLVEDGLYAVASLPSGVFNPYAGVKTSILFFDNELAKQRQEILFIKIEHDGYAIGAQRRPIHQNDLPQALEILNKWNIGEKVENKLALYVEKSKIAENGDYNLSGDRYRMATDYSNAKWQMVAIEDLCEMGRGRVISRQDIVCNPGPFPVFSSQTTDSGIFGYLNSFDFDGEYVTWTTDGANAGTVFYRNGKFNCTNVCGTLKAKLTNINMRFLAKALNAVAFRHVIQVGNPKLMNNVVAKIKIPLPPLEIQEQIVAELDGYAAIIAGAKQIAANWKPRIDIDPEWERVTLGEAITLQRGYDLPKQHWVEGPFPIVGSNGIIGFHNSYKETGPGVVTGRSGTIGKVHYIDYEHYWPHNTSLFVKDFKGNNPAFIKVILESLDLKSLGERTAAVPSLDRKNAHQLLVSIPPVEIQEQIVEKIEAERELVESAKKLIPLYEQKTKEVIAKLWSE